MDSNIISAFIGASSAIVVFGASQFVSHYRERRLQKVSIMSELYGQLHYHEKLIQGWIGTCLWFEYYNDKQDNPTNVQRTDHYVMRLEDNDLLRTESSRQLMQSLAQYLRFDPDNDVLINKMHEIIEYDFDTEINWDKHCVWNHKEFTPQDVNIHMGNAVRNACEEVEPLFMLIEEVQSEMRLKIMRRVLRPD